MSRDPFPEISSDEELDDVWAGYYVECVGCVDMIPAKDVADAHDKDVSPVEWARRHTAEKPWHTRFRTTRIVNFSVSADVPSGYPLEPLPSAP
ncbi:hypothetical protein [Streptomyces sp. SID5910]|uniref:DUF7848 domain-containing protein n=1 Tax=Streptomyces sp. SID5910 TaxID=2690312 RepID=UPI001371B4D2|nr:hypothetical protein [Streptomyces sp. SID5910]MYR43130.1 hypothetical protein [Streptomyces sp. SID5910]